ncbi:hypothetical protein AB0M95_27660 [Sphaerisporangium sp. NPDC051017]|uniref:hypothetical protein n=1 Tax=Sphaerisporangium sp. NPDC051017 TaxID=3154636 RepID=UPI00341C1D5F
MRLPINRPKPLGCPTCSGLGRIVTRVAVLGKGWVTKGPKCGTCKGRGTLRTR